MKKYFLVIKNTWNNNLAYRLSFVLWRLRMIIRFLITFFLWSAIYVTGNHYFGYSRETILTYVILTYLMNSFILASLTPDIGTEINEGKLTNYLTRPINYFSYLVWRDFGNQIFNIGFTVVEVIILLAVLQPPFLLQVHALPLVTSFIALIGATIIYFLLSTLLGFIGFWTSEIWGSRFIFMILLDFLAGGFYPLDILPKQILKFLLLTPFPYIYFFPVKLYLGQLSSLEMTLGFSVLSLWICGLVIILQHVWKAGLRVYSAEGR